MLRNVAVGLLLFLAALLCFSPYAKAGASDFTENFDGGSYYYGQMMTPSDSPWAFTNDEGICCGGSYGGSVDGYNYSSSQLAGHLGVPYGNYAYYYYGNWYMARTWSNATFAPGTLKFWYYLYDASLDVQYTPDGYNWYTAAYVYSYNTYVYGATTSVTIPSGSKGIRFHTYCYSYYYWYGAWIDDIKFTVPWVEVADITGYNKTDINAGVLNLTATTTTVFTGVDRVEWQYKKSTDTLWSATTTDNTPANGFTYSLDTGTTTDGAFQVRARAYDDGNYGDWFIATMSLQNLGSVTLTPPSPTGGDTIMTLSYTRQLVDTWYPANQWNNSSQYCSSGMYWTVDVANTIPYSGTATKVQSNFSYIHNCSSYNYWKLKLFSGSAGSFTEVATSQSIYAEIGLKEYDLSSSTFSNLSKNLLLGQENGYWGCYNAGNWSGNTQSCWYKYAYNTYWYGPYSQYIVPLRIKMKSYGSDIDQVSFQYSADGGPWVSLGNNQIVKVAGQDKYTINWASWAVDSNNVSFRTRLHYGPVWSGTYTFGPYPVRNRIDLTYNVAKSPSAPGSFIPVAGTQLTIGSTATTVPYSTNTGYYGTFTISAPQYIMDVGGTQWRFDYWSDGGGITHEMQILPKMAGTITAFYARQVYFAVDSIVSNYVAPPAGYYEPGTLIQIQVPQYSNVDSVTRYRYVSMDIPSISINTTETWYSFNLPARTIVALNWQLEYYFTVQNDKGVGTGTANGWFSDGATVSYSVAQTLDNGTGARFDNRGYNINSAFGAASRSYTGTLTQPITIQWIWQQQYNVVISSNVGTTTPASGWYDAGTVLSLNSIVPGSTSTVSMTFNGWAGSGTGSVTTSGGSPAVPITVNGYITEVGTWTVSFKLDLIAVNGLGSFSPDATGWYPAGTTVTINIVAPSAPTGSRYIPQWIGEGNGAFSSIAAPDVPVSVTVKMDNPIKESVQWHLQHSLTIENPDGYGTQNPSEGVYWHMNGDKISGVCQYIVGSKMCDGYYGTGSITNGTKPYFSGFITAPTLVRWAWRDRPTAGDQSWNTSELIINIDTPSQMSASRDTAGHPVVAYYDKTAKEIKIAVKDESGWTVTTFRDNIEYLNWLDLYVDTANNPHVTCYAVRDRILHYYGAFETVKVEFAPVTPDVIQTVGDSGRNPHIAVNTMGDVFISFYDMALNALKVVYRMHGSSDWIIETVDAEGNPGMFNAIAVREIDGMPVIAYHSLTLRRLMYAESTDGGWVLSTVDADGAQGFFPSLALAPDGTPMIAYQDVTDSNKMHLKFATRVGDQWSTALVDSTDRCGFNTSIAADENGVIHIGHHDEHNLRYARFNGSAWETMSLGGTNVVGNTAVVLGANGYPQVVYFDGGKITTISAKSGSGGDGGDGGDGGGTTPTTSGGGGGCFVATAAFGSFAASEVSTLTSCRDAVVCGSESGAALVSTYYAMAPSAADSIRSSFAIRAFVRTLLK
ncbi:MAG: CFI-box-CTERM domain-containing protein [Candidatus Brocadiia bacterium]